jgi:hypothetical protein
LQKRVQLHLPRLRLLRSADWAGSAQGALRWAILLLSSLKPKDFEVICLSTERISKSFIASHLICFLMAGLLAASAPIAMAQTASESAMLSLPDAPDAVRSSDSVSSSASAKTSFNPAPGQLPAVAAPSDKFIAPGQQAPVLSAKDKFVMGAKDSITPFSAASWLASAGWSHLINGSPNYGTNSGAFGQRLGASVIRDISEDFLSTSVMANVFHEDPRYYKMGRGHPIGRRVVYAATRAIITRTDSGRATPNYALLSGNLAGSILTNAYYPPSNHGFKETSEIFFSSVGGSALGFGISEFLSDALAIVHLKKSE